MIDIQWKLKPIPSPEVVQELRRELGISKTLSELMAQRGISNYYEAKRFFLPKWEDLHDPYLMKDMDKAVQRILQAIENQEKILIYGDYDVDGTTSVSLMTLFFRAYHIPVEYYIPDREKEGYGLSDEGIDFALENEIKLIITLDCGIKSLDKAQKIAEKGIDLIICDHHLPGKELPKACAILDPKQPDCNYPFKELTGCGIGFKLIQALAPILNSQFKTHVEPKNYIDLVVLSIACDLVPVNGENRILAYYGLQKIRKKPLPGIQKIKELTDTERKWDIADLVFFIGPRINAAGRLKHAKYAVEVLIGESEYLKESAEFLNESNAERRHIEQKIIEDAYNFVENQLKNGNTASIVAYQSDWHKGVIGIVASKMVERYYKPTILLTFSNGKWVGSGRSVHDFDLYEALNACSEHLEQFGGHKYAAGLSLSDNKLNDFVQAFENYCYHNILEHQKSPILEIDMEIPFSRLTISFLQTIERMEPFGPENMRPRFLSKPVRLNYYSIRNEKHIFLRFQQDNYSYDGIMFNIEPEELEIRKNWLNQFNYFEVVYVPELNMDHKTLQKYVQFTIKDFKPLNI